MKFYKYVLDIKLLNFLSVILIFPLMIFIFSFDLGKNINFSFVFIYFLWMFLHEFFHGIGFWFNNDVDRKNIIYGACLEKGIMYCMCKQSISKKSILISIAFPFVFIGIVTLLIGFIFDIEILILLSLFNIVGCIGDIVMFINFLRLPQFSYTDLDDCTGFVLISSDDLSRYRLFGIKLVNSGPFEGLEKPSNYKKLNFSLFSTLVFIGLIILVFSMFI